MARSLDPDTARMMAARSAEIRRAKGAPHRAGLLELRALELERRAAELRVHAARELEASRRVLVSR